MKKLSDSGGVFLLRLNPSASQVIKHNYFAATAIIVKSAFGREEPLKHEAVDQRAHHRAGLFHIEPAEDAGSDSGFYDLAVVAAASVVKLGVQIVKTLVACPYADKVGIGQEELPALLRVGEDVSDQGSDLFNGVLNLRDRFAIALIELPDHPFERAQEEVFLGGEVIERRALAHAGAFGYVLKSDG